MGTARLHMPFSALWKMRIDHPYSLAVRDGSVAWTCGQCPLDEEGRVLAPGDLAGQTQCVARFIQTAMAGVGLSPKSIGKIVAYYVDVGARETRQMMAILRSTFGETALVLPLAVPHFYYEGMLIEVDVHAAARVGTPHRREDPSAGIAVEGVAGDELAWINVMLTEAALAPGSAAPTPYIEPLCGDLGVRPEDLLSDHWFVGQRGDDAASALEALERAGFASDPGAAARAGLNSETGLVGELTFARPGIAGSGRETQRHVSSRGAVTVRQRGRYFWISGRSEQPGLDLVDQTRAAMSAIDAEMTGHGWRFDQVCKVTTHYVGGGSEEDLHANMAVRNAYYKAPGPASTGLPFMGFPCSASLVTVDVLGTEAGS